jgi:hypothetical protein
LPEAEPVDSAIEATATKVAIGDDRTMGQPKTKKKKTGQKVTGGKIARAIAPKRLGTRSLQIPLLTNSSNVSNLNYS